MEKYSGEIKQKTIWALMDAGYDVPQAVIVHSPEIFKEGNRVGNMDNEGKVYINYSAEEKGLELMLGLHDFCYEKELPCTISNLTETKSVLSERYLKIRGLLAKLKVKIEESTQ